MKRRNGVVLPTLSRDASQLIPHRRQRLRQERATDVVDKERGDNTFDLRLGVAQAPCTRHGVDNDELADMARGVGLNLLEPPAEHCTFRPIDSTEPLTGIAHIVHWVR